MRPVTLLRSILLMCAATFCAMCCFHFRLSRQRRIAIDTHQLNNSSKADRTTIEAWTTKAQTIIEVQTKKKAWKTNNAQKKLNKTQNNNGTQRIDETQKSNEILKINVAQKTNQPNKTQTINPQVSKAKLETTTIFSNFTNDASISTSPPLQVDDVWDDLGPENIPQCPNVSPLLKGKLHLNTDDDRPDDPMGNWPPTFEEIAVGFPRLMLGGFYPGPKGCKPRNSIVIIVPYRSRERHLRYFLQYTHGILQRQQSRYIILVVEQDDDQVFNKGQLMNAAYLFLVHKVEESGFDCVFFHDVDIISEDDRNLYRCEGEDKVVHLASRLDKYNYEMCCGVTVGGVLGLTRSQFEKINGFSNQYYGWGGEDDDMQQRIRQIGKFDIFRPSAEYNRFRMIKHESDTRNPKNPQRSAMLARWWERQEQDGLNSLKAELTGLVRFVTHTRLYVKSSPMTTT